MLFFVSVGMLFDPGVLVRSPWAVLATVAVVVAGKPLAALLIVRGAFGRPLAEALSIAASLAQIGEFSFILAGLGVALGLLPEEGRGLVLAASIISILLNPLLFAAAERWRAPREAEPARAERGVGEDEGRLRLTFRHRARSWTVVVEADGTLNEAPAFGR